MPEDAIFVTSPWTWPMALPWLPFLPAKLPMWSTLRLRRACAQPPEPESYLNANLLGFGHILEGCRQNKVGHLLFASSSSVYGMNAARPYSVHHNVDHPVSPACTGHQKKQRTYGPRLQPSVPHSLHGPALFYGVRPLGQARHGPAPFYHGHCTRRSHQGFQPGPHAPRLYLYRYRRGVVRLLLA